MSGRCVVLEQLSPGRQEVATSGGERDHRQARTHDSLAIHFNLTWTSHIFFV